MDLASAPVSRYYLQHWKSAPLLLVLELQPPTTFMNHRGTPWQVPLQSIASRTHRAMTFFKLFGRTKLIRAKTACSSSTETSEQADISRYAYVNVNARDQNDPIEMDCGFKSYEMPSSTAKHLLPPAEMSSRLSHTVQHELPQMEYKHTFGASSPWTGPTGSQQMQPVYEMCGPPTIIAEMPSRLRHDVQHELPQTDREQALKASVPRAELSASRTLTIRGEVPQIEHESAGGTAEDVSHELPNVHSSESIEWGHTFPSDHNSFPSRFLSSSTRTATLLPADRDLSSSKLLRRSPRPVNSAASRPEPICYLSQHRHRLWTEMVSSTPNTSTANGPSCAEADLSGHDPFRYAIRDEAFSPNEEFTSMQPLVEELREYVFIMNHEWLQRLAPYEDLSVLCSLSSVRDLCKLGVNALIEYFNGTIVTNFVNVFALIHVALASAYILHKDDDSYCWDDYLHDMLIWQYAIVDESEKRSFVRVMDELSTPHGISTVPAKAAYSYNEHSSSTLLELLRNGRMIKDCSAMVVGKLILKLLSTLIYGQSSCNFRHLFAFFSRKAWEERQPLLAVIMTEFRVSAAIWALNVHMFDPKVTLSHKAMLYFHSNMNVLRASTQNPYLLLVLAMCLIDRV